MSLVEFSLKDKFAKDGSIKRERDIHFSKKTTLGAYVLYDRGLQLKD